MDGINDRAKALAATIGRNIIIHGEYRQEETAKMIREALEAERNAALEEAAKDVDTIKKTFSISAISNRIRAMRSTQKGGSDE